MNQFTFESKQKTVLFGLMALGLLCLGITYFTDDELHTRFWSNFLHNTVFFTGIAFLALFALLAKVLALSGWQTAFKRVWEAYSMFLLYGVIFMGIIAAGVWGKGFHHLYHWADAEAVQADKVLLGKSSFINPTWFTASVVILAIWYFAFALPFRKLSLREDKEGSSNFQQHNKMKIIAAVFLPVAGFTSAVLIWQWVMSIDAHWYSTMFAWYTTASWFVSMVALTIIMIIYLKSKGYLSTVTVEHVHDLGKYLFGFSIFWTYLWFSQYMLIWYANVGEETVYFQTRRDQYPVLFYGNLIINFAIPFLVLLKNDAKRKFGIMMFASILLLFGHWFDFFQMIKPGVWHTAQEAMAHSAGHAADAAHHASGFVAGFTIPGLLELGTFIGFGAFFVYLAFNQLTKASLEPQNDPYLEESLHHHT